MKSYKQLFSIILGLVAVLHPLTLAAKDISTPIPPVSVRTEMFDHLISEIKRLDGEALMVRQNRPQSFEQTSSDLRESIAKAETALDIREVFNKLDHSYPNLHSYVEFGEMLDNAWPKDKILAARFVGEWLSPKMVVYRISSTDDIDPNNNDIMVGDELVALNGISMVDLQDINFHYCKLPLKSQCDAELSWKLLGRLISFTSGSSVRFTLKRNAKVWDEEIPIISKSKNNPSKRDYSHLRCTNQPDRYKGFSIVYPGNRACIYESNDHPGTAILRITSFAYRDSTDEDPIKSPHDEIQALGPYWQENATWDNLIVDVIDNGGGKAPIPYYKALFTQDFQEQYVKFKKTPELMDPAIRMGKAGLFWGDDSKELWFESIKKSGLLDSIPVGDFLPPIPQFCADYEKPCNEGLFKPYTHHFRGNIHIMVNQWCVSSCDGFVQNVKYHLKDRVFLYGHPQAADPAYSRLTLHLTWDPKIPKKYSLSITPIRSEPPANLLISQTIVATRSTDREGNALAGQPIPIDKFVPETLENRKSWASDVLKAVLEEL